MKFYCIECHKHKPITNNFGYQLNKKYQKVCFECIGHAEVIAFQKTSFFARWKKLKKEKTEPVFQRSNKLQIQAPDIDIELEIAEQLALT